MRITDLCVSHAKASPQAPFSRIDPARCVERKVAMSVGDSRLTFGKHQGEKIRDAPIGYLDWLLGLTDLSPWFRDEVAAYLKTQAEYDAMDGSRDWKEGREDYDPAKD